MAIEKEIELGMLEKHEGDMCLKCGWAFWKDCKDAE